MVLTRHRSGPSPPRRGRSGAGAPLLRHQAAAIRGGDSHPDRPDGGLGPLRETPVEELGYTLPSLLLPLWDSETRQGFHRDAALAVGRQRGEPDPLVPAGSDRRRGGIPRRQSARLRHDPGPVRGVATGRRGDGALHPGTEPFASLPVEQIAETIAPNLQHYLTGDLPGLDLGSVALQQSLVLGIVGHGNGLVDEQHRDAVLDAVGTPQPGVVQKFVVNEQQRSAVFRTDQDAQQFFVEHDGGLRRPTAAAVRRRAR